MTPGLSATLAGALLLATAAGAGAHEREPEKEGESLPVSARSESQGTDSDPLSEEERLKELERRIQLLAEEIEKLKLGQVAEEKPTAGKYGFAPAASKVYGVARGVSLGGYGEAALQNFADQRDDGSAASEKDEFDFVRAIVYLGYKWTDRILFNSELEFEHASSGKKGEISVEFAYIDFFLRPEVNFRGGMVLIPVGLVNELHEPPVFRGALRPQVERLILPTTWRENGGGIFGDAGPFSYRVYLVSGLSSSGFSSASGIRGGRQSGSRSVAEDLAWTGRLDLTGFPGLFAGVSFFTGNSGQDEKASSGASIEGRVSLFDVHGQYNFRGAQVRALYARGTLGDAALVNEKLGLSGSKSVGSTFHGGYLEVGYDLMTLRRGGAAWSVIPFARYESYDTQKEVPEGFQRDPANRRSVLTVGVDLKPHPSVVLKLDYQDLRNRAGTATDQWNVAIGYLF